MQVDWTPGSGLWVRQGLERDGVLGSAASSKLLGDVPRRNAHCYVIVTLRVSLFL